MRAVLGYREARAATVGLRQALFAEACGCKIQEGPARLVLLWGQSSRWWSDCILRTTRRTLKRCSTLHCECCPAGHDTTPRAISPQSGTVCRVPIAGKAPSTRGSHTFPPLTEPSSHRHFPCCMTCSLLYRTRSPRRDEELRRTTLTIEILLGPPIQVVAGCPYRFLRTSFRSMADLEPLPKNKHVVLSSIAPVQHGHDRCDIVSRPATGLKSNHFQTPTFVPAAIEDHSAEP